MWMAWFTFALIACAGCESGTEIAGVGQATAVRASDGRVVVTATLACMLARGMARADGHCDADNTRVCVEARWFKRSDAPATAQSVGQLASAQACRKINAVRGETMQIVLPAAAVPAEADAIVVFSADQHAAVHAPREVVIAQP